MLPLFRSDEGAVDEALGEVEAASLLEVLGQRPKDLVQHAFLGPTLEAPMAGLLRRVAFREVPPRSSGAQDPKYAVEHVPGVPPRSAASVRSERRVGDQRLQEFPLLVGKIHVHSPVLRTGSGSL
jgi:hypothetical protein